MMSRREAIKTTAVALAALATGPVGYGATPNSSPDGPFKLMELPFAVDALEPYMDSQTVLVHHGKHHATYVANLNKAVANEQSLIGKSLEDLLRDLNSVPEKVRTAVRNHGGGVYNHNVFWLQLKKNPGGKPIGELAKAIEATFGSYDNFKDQLSKAAVGVFGSGWGWLTVDANKNLRIEATSNQDSPISQGRTPLLAIDVWEHAYYLKYQNRRADFVNALFDIINWDYVSEQYRKLL